MNESNLGQMMNRGFSNLYRRSAETLSRPVVKRAPGGGTVQRKNAFMKGRTVVYGARNIAHAVAQDIHQPRSRNERSQV